MGWLDGYKYRVPVAVDNGGPAAAVDVTIPLPDDWDLFWSTIDASGVELRITKADGKTVATYQLASSPAFNRTTKVGTIEVDNLESDVTAASVVLCWLYFGNTGASSGAGSFVAAAARTGFIHPVQPRAYVVQGRPSPPGSTRPVERVQKTVGEQILIWFEMRSMLEHRMDESGDSHVWEEVWQVLNVVTLAGATQATLITQNRTRFVESRDPGGRSRFFVGVLVKAGTTAVDYTVEPVITTMAPEVVLDTGALIQGTYRVLEPRALLSVYDVSEV